MEALEALARGTPLIAHGKGGALESVTDGETGLFFGEQTADSLTDVVNRFESWMVRFDPLTIRTSAESLRAERFHGEFLEVVRQAQQQFDRHFL